MILAWASPFKVKFDLKMCRIVFLLATNSEQHRFISLCLCDFNAIKAKDHVLKIDQAGLITLFSEKYWPGQVAFFVEEKGNL